MSEPKSYRIYFNSHAEAPLVWSVDDYHPETERKVKRVEIRVPSTTLFSTGATEPRAWIDCRGVLVISETQEAYILPYDWRT
jgi:hypothetical protein